MTQMFYGIELLYPTELMIVIVAALVISLTSAAVHHFFVDRKRMDAAKKNFEAHQKNFLAAQKANDEKKLKKLEAQYEGLMKEFKDSMLKSMAPSFVTMIPAMGIFWYFNSFFSPLGAFIDMPFAIPFITEAPSVIATNGMGWLIVYLLIALVPTILQQVLLKSLKK